MSRKISVFFSKVLGNPRMKHKIVPEHQPLVIHENKENVDFENVERSTLPESSIYVTVTEDYNGILRIQFGEVKGKSKCFKDVELSLNQLMAMMGIMEGLDFSLNASAQTIMMFTAKLPTDWYPKQKKIELNIIEGLIPQYLEDSKYWQRFCIELTHFMLKRNPEKTSLNIRNHKDGYFQTFTSSNGKTRTLSIICEGLHITEKEMIKQLLTFVPSDSESYKIAEGGLLFGDSLSKVMDTLLEIDKYVIKKDDGNIYYEVNNKPIVIEIGIGFNG